MSGSDAALDALQALRQQARATRRALGTHQRRAAADALRDLAALYLAAGSGLLASYVACHSELDTAALNHWALTQGWQLALPVAQADGELAFRLWDGEPDALERGRFGIPEPVGGALIALADCQHVLVPGLAFDRCGRRLGNGGGYYDRALGCLRHARVRPQFCGIGFHQQLFDVLPERSWDVRMDVLLLDSGMIRAPAAERPNA